MCMAHPAGRLNMKLTFVQVQSYAGPRSDETPRRFQIAGEWIEVQEVIDRWYQAGCQPEWPCAHFFKVRGDDHRDYLLQHDSAADQWFLSSRR